MDIKNWVNILKDPNDINQNKLEIFEFPNVAEFESINKPWGLLLSRQRRIFYPYCGAIILFERTDETKQIFNSFQSMIDRMPEVAQLGDLVNNLKLEVEKDGIFSADQGFHI